MERTESLSLDLARMPSSCDTEVRCVMDIGEVLVTVE